jgi:hypothetical protein
LTEKYLSQKIQIFLEKVKPYKNYWLSDKNNSLYVFFDEDVTVDQLERAYKEATSSMEYFDAENVEINKPKNGSIEMVIPLKRNVIFEGKNYEE